MWPCFWTFPNRLTLYRWMQQGDLPYEDYGGLIDRHVSIEDTMRVKAARKKRDAERVRNHPDTMYLY
jgi:hypothetical protein